MFKKLQILLTTQNSYFTYLQIQQIFNLKNALSQGKKFHSYIARRSFVFATNPTFHNKLICMYVKWGNLDNARKVFDQMTERDNVSWNTIIVAYRRHGCPHEAVTLFHQMQRAGFQPDQFTFASVIPAFAEMGALEQGMVIHQSVEDKGILSDVVVASALVDMYAKCGRLDKAEDVFDRMAQRDVFSWTAMISGFAQNGFIDEALGTFKQMQLAGVKPNSVTFCSILSPCAKMGCLEQGIAIHHSVNEGELLSDIVTATALVYMYAKCGSVDQAQVLFDRMAERNVVSWNAMIAGYAQIGFVENALETFKQMQLTVLKPNSTTFATILPICAKMGRLEQGMDIHRSIIEGGFLLDIVVGNALIDMYAKCRSINTAFKIFNRMPQRNVVSWTAAITGYTQNGFFEKALETFKQMQLAGVKPDSTTFASILSACAKMGALEQVTNIHKSILEAGFLSHTVIGNALVHVYANGGSIDKARQLFDIMPHKNVISWNAIIVGYAGNGFVEKTLETFKQMQLACVKPDSTTFASILSACAKKGALEHGMDIHQSIIEGELLSDGIVANALVDMYAKCGSIDKAREVFDKMPQRNVVSWNSIISGYVENGCVQKALETFKQIQSASLKPNSTTFSSILSACAKMGTLEQGVIIHQSIVEGGFSSDVVVVTALMDMYAKCISIDKACKLFDIMPQRNVFSWNTMIAGYAQNGYAENAIETLKQMQFVGIKPISSTFVSVLPAFAKMGALKQGMDIHRNIIEGGFLPDIIVGNALIDMYAKCGNIDKACELFESMPERDVISWNAMITGYAHNGFCENALKSFELMKHFRTYPDIVSFTCILWACSHAGLLYEGCMYFNQMSNPYCITPIVDHYVCMVDLLGRAGYLEDTLNFIIKLPVKHVVVVWMCFLGACRSHMNIGLGVFTALLLFDLDPENAVTYVLLSNIYAEGGKWGEVQMVRRLMKDRGIKKIPGCSWIESHKMVHTFCARDRSHS